MAATITIQDRSVAGNKYVRTGIGNLGTYAAGGVAVTKTDFDLPVSLDYLTLGPAQDATTAYVLSYDKTNGKIQAFMQSDSDNNLPLAEVGATDISLLIFRWRAEGK